MRHGNRRQFRFGSRAKLGVCAAAIAATTLSDPTVAKTQPDARTQQAMMDAINDEYRARAFYQAAIAKFGEVRPFTNIVQSEDRHVQLWKTMFARYGLPLPEDPFAGNVEVPDTVRAACQMGVEAEIANVQMYDNFLSFVQEPDLRAAFTQLRQVSQNHHKPAFERCAGNALSPTPGTQPRRGRGLGRMRL